MRDKLKEILHEVDSVQKSHDELMKELKSETEKISEHAKNITKMPEWKELMDKDHGNATTSD